MCIFLFFSTERLSILELNELNSTLKTSLWGRVAQPFIKAIWSIKFTRLDIYKWLNNNYKIDSNIILKLSEPNSTIKVSLQKENCPNSCKVYIGHISKQCESLTICMRTLHP